MAYASYITVKIKWSFWHSYFVVSVSDSVWYLYHSDCNWDNKTSTFKQQFCLSLYGLSFL